MDLSHHLVFWVRMGRLYLFCLDRVVDRCALTIPQYDLI